MFVCVLVLATPIAAGWWIDPRPAMLVQAATIGIVLALAVWIAMAIVAPPRRVKRITVPPAQDFQETRISAIPRRRHEHESITVAVTALRQAVKERLEALPSLGHKAGQDPLTRLADRASLYALSDWLDETAALSDVELCLLCVELRGVEPVKARFGGEAGDHVLTKVAKRLRDVSREEDFLFRLGNDEFMLMVPSPRGTGPELARSVGQRVLSNVQRPLPYLTVSNLPISCSVGSAIWPLDGGKLGDVLRMADTALADTRVSGNGNFRQYGLHSGQMA